MKHLFIILSIILLSSPLFGQSKKSGLLYIWENGSRYVGEMINKVFSGQGTLAYSDGRKFVGEFKNGKYHGQGTMTYPDRSKYEGKWKEGKYHGQGTFTFSDGNVGVGEFRENRPWNITTYNKYGIYKWKYVKGLRVE